MTSHPLISTIWNDFQNVSTKTYANVVIPSEIKTQLVTRVLITLVLKLLCNFLFLMKFRRLITLCHSTGHKQKTRNVQYKQVWSCSCSFLTFKIIINATTFVVTCTLYIFFFKLRFYNIFTFHNISSFFFLSYGRNMRKISWNLILIYIFVI